MTTVLPARSVRTHFRLLGPFEVWRADRRVSVGGRRTEHLLAFLVLESPHAVSLGRLVEAVWGPQPPSTAAHQVRKMIGTLRQQIDPGGTLIITEGPGYGLRVSPDQVDLAEFDSLVAAAEDADPVDAIAGIRAALALWRGPALSGIGGMLIETAARALDERRVAAVERLADLCLADGRPGEVLADLTRAVGEHPMHERLRYLQMVALHRSGRRADAFTAYDEGRRLLSDELGVDPGRDLAHLYQRMLHNDPSLQASGPAPPPERAAVDAPPAPPTGSELPYDIPDFVGRRNELAALSGLIPGAAELAVIVVAIDGMAGVGKTALAIRAAHRLAERFPDGQLFLDLLGYTEKQEPMQPVDALERLLRAVGVPAGAIPADVAARSALWRATIAGRSMVLLLDNAASAAQIRPLVPGSPGCVTIVTGRARLADLDGVVPVSLAPPSHDDCVAIVRNVLGDGRVANEAAEVDDLVKMCGHLPLAVRIAAARLQKRPGWTIAHLLERLRDDDRSVDEFAVGDRSVAAAFRATYDALPSGHRRVFRLVGLLPTIDFTAREAAAVSGLPQRHAEYVVEDLLDARLVEQRAPGRYQFHDLLRVYAHASAHEEDAAAERERAVRAGYATLLGVVSRCVPLAAPGWIEPVTEHADKLAADLPAGVVLPQPPTAEQALALLDAEIDNVVAAARASLSLGVGEYLAPLATGVRGYLDLRSLWRVQAELLQLAVQAARRRRDPRTELHCLVRLFEPLWRQGRVDEARSGAETALQLARRVGDRTAEAECLGNIAALLGTFGQLSRSLDYHERSLAIHRDAGRSRDEAAVLLSQACVLDALGRHDQALRAAQRAQRIVRELAGGTDDPVALVGVAMAEANLGLRARAEETLAAAVLLATDSGVPHRIALTHTAMARVLLGAGRLVEALEYGEIANAALTTMEAPGLVNDLQNTLGEILLALGRDDDAGVSFDVALRSARLVGDRPQHLRAIVGLLAATPAQACGSAAVAPLCREGAALAAAIDPPRDWVCPQHDVRCPGNGGDDRD